jgi:hypothetical protein
VTVPDQRDEGLPADFLLAAFLEAVAFVAPADLLLAAFLEAVAFVAPADLLVAAFLEAVAFVAPADLLVAAFLEAVAFVAPALAAVFFGVAFVRTVGSGRIAGAASAPADASTVSVPGAGITIVSPADGHRTRTIEPITAVTTPSRSGPLPDDKRIRSPAFTMSGHLFCRSSTNAEL